MIEARASDHVNVARIFAELANSARRQLIGDKVHMRHLGYRMANRFVKSPLGRIATCDVRQRDVMN